PTGHAEPVVDVLLGIVGAQRFQPVEDRDALAELTQLGAGELLLELRLSDEEELDQLVALILEVGEQADLLELVALEVLRLVENQDRVVSARAGLPQEPLERRNRLGLAERAGVREPEAQADVLEQLVTRQRGVGDERYDRARLVLGEHVVERGGLSGADLACDQDERLEILDPEA